MFYNKTTLTLFQRDMYPDGAKCAVDNFRGNFIIKGFIFSFNIQNILNNFVMDVVKCILLHWSVIGHLC